MSAFFFKKGSLFSTQKVSVLLEIGVFFGQKSAKGGFFLHLENTDGLPLIHESGGAGSGAHVSEVRQGRTRGLLALHSGLPEERMVSWLI